MHTPVDRRTFLKLAGGTLALGGSTLRAEPPAVSSKGLVVGPPEAAAAGMAVLAAGGNAVDAAVAAALVVGVVAVPSCGIGGYGGHLVLGKPSGDQVVAIDFNSTAPAAARPDMFPLNAKGAVQGSINTHGWLAAGVPGTLAGLQLALDRHGTQPFARLVQPAIRHAREGFAVPRNMANALKASRERMRRDPGSAKLFFPGGEPLAEGVRFRNPELADLLQTLAERGGVDSFYRGDIAGRIAAAFRQHGGLVTAEDLAAYRAREVAPLTLAWQGFTIHTAPLTAGGLTILQALATLKVLDWARWDRKEPAATQARVEALRIAWHDRLRLLGDPQHATVPVERLLSERYAEASAERVRAALKHKKPVAATSDGRSAGGTIHLTAADAAGLMVALTLTHGGGFGAQVTVDRLGLLLGHGMSRFDPHPDHPNAPGPGKRPLHNMCPTIVSREGRPLLALGAAGGRRIPNTVFDMLTYRLGEGRPLEEAVGAPRMHTEGGMPLTLEAKWPAAETEYLKQVGYAIKTGPGAKLNAIEREPATGALRSAER
jgi:gamma-glutamyltranspeptidase/glutathione hydrolase